MGKEQFPDQLNLALCWRYRHRRPWWRDPLGLRMVRRRFRVMFFFRYVRTDRSQVISVPRGTTVDGASIPCFCYRLIGPPWGDYAEASVIHDYLWTLARRNRDGVTFAYANEVFLEAMEVLGVARWRRGLMWLAVTLNAWRLTRRRR